MNSDVRFVLRQLERMGIPMRRHLTMAEGAACYRGATRDGRLLVNLAASRAGMLAEAAILVAVRTDPSLIGPDSLFREIAEILLRSASADVGCAIAWVDKAAQRVAAESFAWDRTPMGGALLHVSARELAEGLCMMLKIEPRRRRG